MSVSSPPTDIPGPRGDVLMKRYNTGKVKEPATGFMLMVVTFPWP